MIVTTPAVPLPTVDQWLNHLRSKIGVAEHPLGSNCQEFSHYLGRECESWCADFLVASARRTGLILPNESAYTPTLAQGFKDAGRWGARPARGAFGFVYHTSEGRIAHTFNVEAVNQDESFATLEGNSNNGGSREGLYVCRHRRTMAKGSGSWVVGFGYPKFAEPVTHRLISPKNLPPHPKWWTHTTHQGQASQEVASALKVLNRPDYPPQVTLDANVAHLFHRIKQQHGDPDPTGALTINLANIIQNGVSK